MPSLRKRVTSYIRQLSFHNEPREKRLNVNENSFVTKYLQGQIKLRDGPPIISGKNPTDLPNYDLETYIVGPDTIIGCYTGPIGGLTTVKRTEKHLSVTDPDIDFIDTQEENALVGTEKVGKSPNKINGLPIDNTSMVIKVAGQEYFVTNRMKQHNKSHSFGSLSDFNIEIETTKIDRDFYANNNNKNVKSLNDVKNSVSSHDFDNTLDLDSRKQEGNVAVDPVATKEEVTNFVELKEPVNDAVSCINKINQQRSREENRQCELRAQNELKHSDGVTQHENFTKQRTQRTVINNKVKTKQMMTFNENAVSKNITNKKKEENADQNYIISKSKSEGNPFQHKKRGKIIRIQRPASNVSGNTENLEPGVQSCNDFLLPEEWSSKSDHIYGLSDSLYDRNQITKTKNGDPIADCFGVIGRNDSAILAVADGVNWGEKACIAAKSAIHGCLHYLNKTIFNDTKPFENLVKIDSKDAAKFETPLHNTRITNTQEVFVCLLRAFNCAHDLILENNGMLTTLTVVVVLPLKQSNVRVERLDATTKWSDQRDGQGMAKRYDKSQTAQADPREKNELNSYVCCVCNVGDTLAYVYSQKHGMREITKGSHDIHCNRDMRDALGALGPVDGINPELSNLTLSVTTVQKGDIIFVASDGLTDNFDPNVCKFTVNSNLSEPVKVKKQPQGSYQTPTDKENKKVQPQKAAQKTHRTEKHHRGESSKKSEEKNKPPIKPPRRHHNKTKDNISRSSAERSLRSGSEDSGGVEAEITKTLEEMAKIVNKSEVIGEIMDESTFGENSSHTHKTDEHINFDNQSINIHRSNNEKSLSTTVHLVNDLKNNFTQSSKTNEKLSNLVTDGIPDVSTNELHKPADTSDNLPNNSDVASSSNEPNTSNEEDVKQSNLSNPLIAQFILENSIDQSSTLDKCKESLQTQSLIHLESEDAKVSSIHTEQKSDHFEHRQGFQYKSGNFQHKFGNLQHKSAHFQHKSTNLPNRSDNYEHKLIKNCSSQKQSSSQPKMVQSLETFGKTQSINRNPIDKTSNKSNESPRYSFLRSKTSLDLHVKTISRNADGIPYVTPVQRYELTLLLMEDVLRHGISGRDAECVTAKKLCENLVSFTFSITAAKRHTLEDNDLYFDNQNGLLVEVTSQEKKIRRKKGLERVQSLPGKLDHVTVVAFNVGNFSF